MKKLLLIPFFICLFFSIGHTQDWFSANDRWSCNLSGGFAGFYVDFEVYAVADTIIQSHNARKWVVSAGPLSHTPRFTYADGSRAYIFVPHADSFALAYDFTMVVGDTLSFPTYVGAKFTYVVDSIDVVLAGDLYLNRQRVHYVNPNGQPSSWNFDILEHIGMVGLPFDEDYPSCSYPFIPDYDCNSVVDGFDTKFLCFSSVLGNYKPYNGICKLVDTEDPAQTSFSLQPNPAGDSFILKSSDNNSDLLSLRVFDINGQTVCAWATPMDSYSIANLPNGLYLVEAIFENGLRKVEKLIKQ